MNGKNKNPKRVSAIHSAAIQDHLLRKMNLEPHLSFGKPVPKRRKTVGKLPQIDRKSKQNINHLQKLESKSILPYENQQLKKAKEQLSDAIKLNQYRKQLTWAQKLGIVEAPPLPLGAKDWAQIEQRSKKRGDSHSICSICLQDFKIEQQVLLSCSHVFHEKCLRSYQKHNRLKCCPICRRQDYQKKIIDEAIRVFTLKSIVRIQSVFRGSCDRIRLYSKLVAEQYNAVSIRFKRRLIGFKMWQLSQKINEKRKREQGKYQQMLEKVRNQYEKQKADIMEQIMEVHRGKQRYQQQIRKYLAQLEPQHAQQDAVDWEQVKEQGLKRCQQECSICLTTLWVKPVYILSCTHIFHVNCIQSFERYAVGSNRNKCPCCRAQYTKKKMQAKKYRK